jgi:hypothetical protein
MLGYSFGNKKISLLGIGSKCFQCFSSFGCGKVKQKGGEKE